MNHMPRPAARADAGPATPAAPFAGPGSAADSVAESTAPSAESPLVAGVANLASTLAALTSYPGAGLAARRAVDLARAAGRRLAELERLAVTDGLTGLLNRRGLELELARVMAAARRYREKGVIIFIDLDGFKPINDTFGHSAGDAVLRHVAALLAKTIRATDSAARLGGDEFAVLLTRTDWENGLKRAEAFDRLINGSSVVWDGRVVTVRASFGFQTYGPGDDLTNALRAADHSMYATKKARADSGLYRARAQAHARA
jgi:diguanylate cyclase (GGDEF)-like protein